MQCKQFRSRMKNGSGFTLIEVIVSLIVASILGVMLVSFMGSSVVQSANPVIMAQNGAYLNEIMENMSADYRAKQVANPGPAGLANFRTNVETANYYSDSSHPYTVVDSCISFPNGTTVNESAGTCSNSANTILKVTVTYNDLSVTALFTG
ncbi:MAG: prepilin-type N-terminal cleavage/methylation domain-containing protein [Syntrophales bacterium]|jgi:prepilin-type N-terminal cleavage/methylation domain-containing protein|nr:prepilin-type N-terminal cleavage/methylation domain-containing protein [Syntrophales bacterium]MCK9391050.1 prepilin-type N-terminal cleavage/methylation domain-containing protein [Syntrophales bacterium]